MNPNDQNSTPQLPQPQAQPQQNAPDLSTNAQILANAIRLNEGGSDYNAKGDNGASWGAYQFGQGAWDNAAKLAGLSSKWGQADATDQNAAADAQIKQWLIQGKTPPQIASMWNAGPGAPDAYKGTFPDGSSSVGYNATDKVNYDVPSYAKNVLDTAARLFESQQQAPQIQSDQSATPNRVQDVKAGLAAIGAGPGSGSAGLGLGGGILSTLMGTAKSALPGIGAAGAEALLPEGGPASLVAGASVGQALANMIPGQQGQQTQNQNQPQAQQPSATYSALKNALSQTIGGNQVIQEGEARGVDPIAAIEQSGAVPQPDANGNLDKLIPISILRDQIKQDKQFQAQALATMDTPTSLNDVEKDAIAEATAKMQGSPELTDTIKKIRKTFANYREQQPKGKDKYGYEYTKSFHVSPAQLQQMKERSAEGQNWATPSHERSASQHVYAAMKKKLSEVAKKHNVKGWDETNKRMEGRLLAIKAIKKLPKKAERNRGKEFRKDLLASLAGAGIARAFGQNSFAGGLAGHLIERQLGGKEYKKIGTKSEQKTHEQRAKMPVMSLLSRKEPSKNNAK